MGVTGSWRVEQQLQLWDFRSDRPMETLSWRTTGVTLVQPCMLYAAQFSKCAGSSMIAAGGGGANEAKLFDRQSGQVFGAITGLKGACYSIDFSHDDTMVAIGSGD